MTDDHAFQLTSEFEDLAQAVADQSATFLPRTEYDAAHTALVDRVNANSERMAALELRLTSRLDRGEGADVGAAGQRTDQRLNTSSLIGIAGTVLALVAIAVTIIIATRH